MKAARLPFFPFLSIMLLLCSLMPWRATAQERISIEALGTVGYMTPVAGVNEELLHSHTTAFYDLRMRYQTRPEDHSPYDALFRYPAIQAGILVGDLTHVDVYRQRTPYHSTLGCTIAPYFGFQRNIFQHGRWSVGYMIQNGLSFNTRPFNEKDNVDNEFIGGLLSMHFGLGLAARLRLTPQWTLSAAFDFKHNSAASMVRPNLGVNAFGGTLGVSYDLVPQAMTAVTEQAEAERVRDVLSRPFARYVYGELSAAVSPKALPDYFNVYHTGDCPVYASYNVMASVMYRWRLNHASGIAMDYSYIPYTHRLRELDALQHHDVIDGRTLRYSPHLFGIMLRHDVFYRHFCLNLGLGTFLHRRQGWRAETQESRIYQLIGLRYALPFTSDRLFLGYTIKAYRFSKVDGMLFGIGWRFQSPTRGRHL